MVTTADASEADDNVFAVTAHELAYILDLVPGEHSQRAIETLGLPAPEEPGPMLVAGVATLLVRQLASIDVRDEGAVVVPGELAALVGDNLTGGSQWVELAFMSESATEATYLSVGPHSTVVLTPRLFGTFEIRFMRPAQSRGRGIADLMHAFLTSNVPAVAFARVRSGDGAGDLGLAVRLLEDGTIELSRDEGEEPLTGTGEAGAADIMKRVAEVIEEGLRSGTQE